MQAATGSAAFATQSAIVGASAADRETVHPFTAFKYVRHQSFAIDTSSGPLCLRNWPN